MIAEFSQATRGARRWLLLESNWWKVIALLWVIILTSPFLLRQAAGILPASIWYELHRVEVTDEFDADGGRILSIDRDIHKVFKGNWSTTEEILLEYNGGFTTVRKCIGEATYRPDKELPEPVTLDWWIDRKTFDQIQQGAPQNCEYFYPWNVRGFNAINGRLPEGTYRLCTNVTIKTKYGDKYARRCSDVYHVPATTPTPHP